MNPHSTPTSTPAPPLLPFDDPNHTPGNGTRYHLLLVPRRDGSAVFAWVDAPRGGACMLLCADTVAGEGPEVDAKYLVEKMGLPYYGDTDALLAWLEARGVAVWRERG